MYNIIKAPVYVGEDYPPVDTKTGDFIWLQKFPENEFNVKFISRDGDARATVFLDVDSKVNRELVWVIDVFVVDAKDREQGKGEEALLQLLHEIRDNEYKLIKKIYRNLIDKDVPFKAARAASEGSSGNIIKIIEEKITGPNAFDKLDIRLGDVDPDAQGFWQKMYNRYGGYDRDGKYLGLKKSTTITTTTGKTKTVNLPLVEDDEEEPPEEEEEERNYCIEKYREIFMEIETVYEKLYYLSYEVNFQNGTLIHSNDMNSNYVTTNFSRQADEKYVQYIGAYYYEWGQQSYSGKGADRIFGLDMMAPLPDKLPEEEACFLLYLLSKTIIRNTKTLNLGSVGNYKFYYNLELSTDSAHNYLSSKYLSGLIVEWYSGDLEKSDPKLKVLEGYDFDMRMFYSKIFMLEHYLLKIIQMAKKAVREYPDGEDYFERFY